MYLPSPLDLPSASDCTDSKMSPARIRVLTQFPLTCQFSDADYAEIVHSCLFQAGVAVQGVMQRTLPI